MKRVVRSRSTKQRKQLSTSLYFFRWKQQHPGQILTSQLLSAGTSPSTWWPKHTTCNTWTAAETSVSLLVTKPDAKRPCGDIAGERKSKAVFFVQLLTAKSFLPETCAVRKPLRRAPHNEFYKCAGYTDTLLTALINVSQSKFICYLVQELGHIGKLKRVLGLNVSKAVRVSWCTHKRNA